MRYANTIRHITLLVLLGVGLGACGADTNAESTSDDAKTLEQQASNTGATDVPATPTPAPVAAPQPQILAASEPVCADCGTISGIEQRTREGKGTGLGAATGAVLGAIAGREIVGGKRSHRDAAAVAGAIGGGYAGHKVEEKARSSTYYLVSVRMESDQRIETVTLESAEGWLVGDKVRVDNGALIKR